MRPKITLDHRPELDGDAEPIRTLREIVDDAIEKALKHTHGNVTRAAAVLDISPHRIYRRIAKMRAEYTESPPRIGEG